MFLPSARGTWHDESSVILKSSPSRRSLARRATVTITCQILPYEIASGPANMALDEALLDRVSAQPEFAYLRMYGWTVPTLSLGYFQHLAQARAEPRWRSVPLVRRATGGGAIWHHHELTYALALPARHPQAQAEHGPLPECSCGHCRDHPQAGAGSPPPCSRGILGFRRQTHAHALSSAFPTAIRRISWPRAAKSWEVHSGSARGRSCSTGQSSCNALSKRPSSGEFATSPTFPRTLVSGPLQSSGRSSVRSGWHLFPAIDAPGRNSVTAPGSWSEPSIELRRGPHGASDEPLEARRECCSKKARCKPSVPKIRSRRGPQVSWISETFSYNDSGRLTGDFRPEHFRSEMKTSQFGGLCGLSRGKKLELQGTSIFGEWL